MQNFSLKSIKLRYQLISLMALLLGLLATRRWQQIISPQVWAEDGVRILPQYIREGWFSFFEPVNGYLVTIPKIISAVSLEVSFLNYPLISTILSWLFITLVGLAIAYSPTKMHDKALCAIAVFMIPSDPEVFGLPLYTFWWSSLLLFLVALWDEKVPLIGWRIGFVMICGLSSPVIIAILPILYFRSYRYRSLHAEHTVASIATLIAAVQLYFILQISSSEAGFPPLESLLKFIVPKFFGRFLIGNWIDNGLCLWLAGMGVSSLMIGWLIHERHRVCGYCFIFWLYRSC